MAESERPRTTFSNHRGVAPLLWVFMSIACLELLAVHLFVSLKWPGLAWPLSFLTGLSILWLIFWIRSWARLPHELRKTSLILHMGSLRHIEVPLGQIKEISRSVDAVVLKRRDTRKLVPIAFPNRIVLLDSPIGDRRAIQRIAVRFDDPAAFDTAMSAIGIPIC